MDSAQTDRSALIAEAQRRGLLPTCGNGTMEVRIHAKQRTYKIDKVEFWVGSVLGRSYCIIIAPNGEGYETTRENMAGLLRGNRAHGLRLVNRT